MAFDLNLARSIVTVLAFATFIGICWWAYGRDRRSHFDDAARVPLDDDRAAPPRMRRVRRRRGR